MMNDECIVGRRNGSNRLFEAVPIDWLTVYRIAFGTVMCWYACRSLASGVVRLFYVTPLHHFPYPGFEWVRPIDFSVKIGEQVYEFIQIEYTCLALMALLIAIGLFYRFAAVVFAVGFTHVFLLDKSYYQNHDYLVTLLAWLLVFLPANRATAVDAILWPKLRARFIPAWTLWLIRFQIAVPYFFGGLAKIDADWLRGQPMRAALPQKVDAAFIGGPWFQEEWCVQLVIWGGLLFDLFIVPALLWQRTRLPAFCLCVAFHLTNSLIWTIGIFPWLMIAATTVFFEPDWPRRIAAILTRRPRTVVATDSLRSPSRSARWITVTVLAMFVTWQLLLPLRHLWTPGNPHWDEMTHHFSWHMLLRAKETGLRIYITDPKSGRTGTADLRSHVTARQLGVIARDPMMIYQLCHHVRDDLERRGYHGMEIRVLALISLNGRRPQPIIDPHVDLATALIGTGVPDWVMPLQEPFRHDAWEVPLSEWEQNLELDLPAQMPQLSRPKAASSPAVRDDQQASVLQHAPFLTVGTDMFVLPASKPAAYSATSTSAPLPFILTVSSQ